ncbi:MAG: tetratricopeptide repeat protein [Kiloniellales bacterium]
MRTLGPLLLAVALLLAALPARADQNDPRLPPLFAELKQAPDPQSAHEIEMNIWSAWFHSSDGAVSALMEQGARAMDRRDFTAAQHAFDQVVALAPDYAEGWNRRATLRYLTGDLQGSLEDITETLAREPRHFGALAGRGLVYMALDEPVKALDSFEAALKIHPNLPGPQVNSEMLKKRLKDNAI